jgi:hypothetical protein
MSGLKRRGLLGRIAGLGWFTQNGEPAATQALVMLLEDELLRDHILRRAEKITGADLQRVKWFQAETVLDDNGRLDLEGIDADGRPVLVIEAKFGAYLSVDQVRAYLNDQERRMGNASHAFLLLVPHTRAKEAQRVLDAVRAERDAAGREPHPAATGVITWDAWLDTWDRAVADLPATPDSIAGDLYQLRELCTTLGGLVVAPFGASAAGSDWRNRQKDLALIFDQLSVRLLGTGIPTNPIQHEPGYDPQRYVALGVPAPETHYSLGVAERFADEGLAPIWMRFHRKTDGFSIVRVRLMSSDYADLVRTDDDHLWLPLEFPGDLAGPDLVDHLVARVAAVTSLLSREDWG